MSVLQNILAPMTHHLEQVTIEAHPPPLSADQANTEDEINKVARTIGIVDVDSKLHFAAKHMSDTKLLSRWRATDWLLGTIHGQFLGLGTMAVTLIALGALVWMTTGGHEDYNTTWVESLWFSWGMFFDPGTQTGFAASDPFSVKIVAVVFSICGFLFNLIFLGLMVDMVRNLLELWRKQHSRIVSNGHTLLLGWTQKSLFVIEELRQSCQNQGDEFKLVILADCDELQIQREISRHFHGMSMVNCISVRSGSPFECDDLERVSAKSARAIIILSGSGPSRQVDLTTVRAIVALAALPKRPMCPIIAEVRAPETSQAIRVVMDTAEGIYARDAVRRVMCLTAVEPAVGDVYQQIMSWVESAEIYVRSLEELGVAGAKTVGAAQESIPRGSIIGIRPGNALSKMAPPADQLLEPTDHLLVVADSLVDLQDHRSRAVDKFRNWVRSEDQSPRMSRYLTPADIRRSDHTAKQQKIVVIVGWPMDVDDMICALEDYLLPGSEIIMLSSLTEKERVKLLRVNLRDVQKGSKITHMVGNTTSVFALANLPLNEADAIIVVADIEHSEDPRMADSASLQAAITLDGLLKGRYPAMFEPNKDGARPRIICEVQGSETERALKGGKSLGEDSVIQFFPSGALETGLFTVACYQTPVFNATLMMLQYNRFGDTIGLPAELFLTDEERKGSKSILKRDIFKRVREHGDVLLAIIGPGETCATVTPPHKVVGDVEPKTLLIVVSRRKFHVVGTQDLASAVANTAANAFNAAASVVKRQG